MQMYLLSLLILSSCHLSSVKSFFFLTDAQTVALAIVSLNHLIHFTIKYTNQFTISNAI